MAYFFRGPYTASISSSFQNRPQCCPIEMSTTAFFTNNCPSHDQLATPPSAAGALTHYRAAADLFPRVIALSPDMEEIDGFELSRRARAEVEP